MPQDHIGSTDDEATPVTLETVAAKVDWLAIAFNQLYVQLTASGSPLSGAPMPLQVPVYVDPYTVGGTGEQNIPNMYGYRV